MAEQASGTASVSDRRTAPRGVLPRGAQTWLLAAVALGILGIIVVTGRPEPSPRPTNTTSGQQSAAPSPDRLRDYQDRLRVLDERSRQEPGLSAARENAAWRCAPVAHRRCARRLFRHDSPSLLKLELVLTKRQIPTVDDLRHHVGAVPDLEVYERRLAILQFVKRWQLTGLRLDVGELPIVPD
jgi:hypothetical protein